MLIGFCFSMKTLPLLWQNVPAPIAQSVHAIHNNTEQSQQPKEKKQKQLLEQRRNQAIQTHMSKRTSNVAQMNDDDDIDVESFVDRNFNDYSDNSATDHMDDEISQPPIAKGLPTKFMFRGMRGQRQYDVPQIGECRKYTQYLLYPSRTFPPHAALFLVFVLIKTTKSIIYYAIN